MPSVYSLRTATSSFDDNRSLTNLQNDICDILSPEDRSGQIYRSLRIINTSQILVSLFGLYTDTHTKKKDEKQIKDQVYHPETKMCCISFILALYEIYISL